MAAPYGTDTLKQYRSRCVEQTKQLDKAALFFEAEVELELRTPKTFRVTVALQDSVDTESVGPAQADLLVACQIEARLVASSDALDISPTDWAKDQYIPPDPTTWSWVVTSRSTRTAEAVLQLKPVIRVTRSNGDSTFEDLRTEDYPVTFITEATVGDRVSASWRWLVGAAGGLGAILGLIVTVRSLRRRDGAPPRAAGSAPAAGGPGPDPPPDLPVPPETGTQDTDKANPTAPP